MTVRQVPLSSISNPALRQLAEKIDGTKSVAKKDGVLTSAEVDKAIALAASKPATFGDVAALRSLKTFLVHMGQAGGTGAGNAAALSGGGYSPLAAMTGNMMGTVQKAKEPLMLSEATRPDAVSARFEVPYDKRQVADRQSVVLPLDGKEMHLIELQYQDTRKLKDLEMNYREKGSYEWKTFRGDKYFDLVAKEKSGQVEIKRESDHGGPWVNNPIRVKVEVLYPDGHTHEIGKKFLDFHVHDAHSADSSGYAEIDNISNGYENLPYGQLPEGCLLRLTPMHENRKPWEADRTVAMELSWVKPQYLPHHKDKVTVFSAGDFVAPDPKGYPVDPNRKIAAVLVEWTDHGKPYSGGVSIGKNEKNQAWQSPSSNVGSGETELIAVDQFAKDGRIKVNGNGGVDVRTVTVLYAD